jgi:hypothetical protein
MPKNQAAHTRHEPFREVSGIWHRVFIDDCPSPINPFPRGGGVLRVHGFLTKRPSGAESLPLSTLHFFDLCLAFFLESNRRAAFTSAITLA